MSRSIAYHASPLLASKTPVWRSKFIVACLGLAFVGLALMGAGTSALFPLAMSAAAQRTDRPTAINVAALAQTGVDRISIGGLTKDVKATDYSMRFEGI